MTPANKASAHPPSNRKPTMAHSDHSTCVLYVCHLKDEKTCPVFIAERRKQEIVEPHEKDTRPHSDDEWSNGAWNGGLDTGFDLGLEEGKRVAADTLNAALSRIAALETELAAARS